MSTNSPSRVPPFGALDDFAPKPKSTTLVPKEEVAAVVDKVAKENNFPSRQANPSRDTVQVVQSRQPRRFTTGRNQQLNIKVTAATADRFYRLADAAGVPQGEILARALDALEAAMKPQK